MVPSLSHLLTLTPWGHISIQSHVGMYVYMSPRTNPKTMTYTPTLREIESRIDTLRNCVTGAQTNIDRGCMAPIAVRNYLKRIEGWNLEIRILGTQVLNHPEISDMLDEMHKLSPDDLEELLTEMALNVG